MEFFAQYDEVLTSAERALVGRARVFCDEAFSGSTHDAFLKSEPFPREWISKWAAEGMLGLQARPEHGGHGASFMCKIRVAQEVARHGFAAAFCLNNLQGQATRISRVGTDEQRRHLLAGLIDGTILSAPAMSEPGGGSDLGAMTTTATAVEGGWKLNGTKAWVSNGAVIDYATMLVRIGDGADRGTLLVGCEPGPSMTREDIMLPGARSFRLATLTFRDHFVPRWALLGVPGDAVRSSMAAVNGARIHVAAMCVATLHAALCEAVGYSGERKAFGKNLLAHQGLQWELAEVALRLEAASALVFKAALHVDRNLPAMTIAAQCKKFAVDVAAWGIEQCIRAVGAVGATGQLPLAMHLAEVRMAAFADGTNEMMLDRIGRALDKDYASIGAREGISAL